MNTLEIQMLGPSGSGKTVFMSSLYSRLRLRRPENTFYLRADIETSLSLNSIYNTVVDPAGDWPLGTRAVKDWDFGVSVPASVGDLEPLRIRYTDYAGGILTDPRAAVQAANQEALRKLRSAHGLLVLLDGIAVGELARGEAAGAAYFDRDLATSFEIAQQSSCPVHFVVTKWDLLEAEFSLAAVRDALFGNENFANLVAAKESAAGAPIRLIPVSSVGSGFARRLPDGTMEKTGAPARPLNVEIPLIAVLPDFMQFAHEQLRRSEADMDQLPDQLSPLAKLLTLVAGPNVDAARLTGTAAGLLQTALPTAARRLLRRNPMLAELVAGNAAVVADALTGFADRLVRAAGERVHADRAAFQADLHKKRLAVRDTREAYELIERQFASILADFETAYPESVIAGGIRKFADQKVEVAS